MAKSRETAISMAKIMQLRKTKKTYLARVKGKFPGDISHLRLLTPEIIFDSLKPKREGGDMDDDDDENEDSPTIMNPFSNQDNSSVISSAKKVVKRPLTREERKIRKQKKLEISMNAKREYESFLELNASENVFDRENLLKSSRVGCALWDHDGKTKILVQCPLGILNHKDGSHACRTDGKNSVSGFHSLGYDEASDTSLIACHLFTGRSHQLRLHLQLLGHPIANDPCYGGELFFESQERRQFALKMKHFLKFHKIETLTKIPYFPEERQDESDALDEKYSKMSLAEVLQEMQDVFPMSMHPEVENPVDNLSEEERQLLQDLKASCRYCAQQNVNLDFERLLHCEGIWLYSFQYEGPNWKFRAPWPEWTEIFKEKDTLL